MAIKITFNGIDMNDSEESFLYIESLINEDTKVSGSMGTEFNYFVFNDVNKEVLMYYIKEFNKLKNIENEVKFDIQTNDGKAKNL